MTTIWEAPPTPDEIMRRTAQWVARLYGLKIVFTVCDGRGNVATTTVDRLDAPVGKLLLDAAVAAERERPTLTPRWPTPSCDDPLSRGDYPL